MPLRGTLLTDYECGLIDGMSDANFSISAIATRLKRSYNCVRKYLKRKSPYLLSGGRPKSLTLRDKRHISRLLITNDRMSVKKIVSTLNIRVSDQTVYRFLHQEAWKYVPAKKRPALTEIHKQKRFSWAKNLIQSLCLNTIDISRITFVDEKRFLLDGPDNVRYYWHKLNSQNKIVPKATFCKGVTVWGGIGMNGTTSLFFTNNTIDSSLYESILKEHYLPFHNRGFVLAQDNATCHVSAMTRSFMEKNKIDTIPWAARSPDCNPIENLWAILVNRIYGERISYENCEDLKTAISREWNNLRREEIKKLVQTFPERLCAVVAAQGGSTNKF